MKRKYTPYYVKWIDSSGYLQSTWRAIEDYNNNLREIETLGFLIKEDKKSMTFLASVSNLDCGMSDITIPKSGILKKKRLSI